MDILVALQKERDKLQQQLATVDAAIGMFTEKAGKPGRGRKRGKMSAAHRAKLAAAQRKRWAAVRSNKKSRKKGVKNAAETEQAA